MPEPRRSGPGASALTLQRGSKLSFLQESEKETELRKAEDAPFASLYVISLRNPHAPAQTFTLSTLLHPQPEHPKDAEPQWPKDKLSDPSVGQSPNRVLCSIAVLFSYCSVTLFPAPFFVAETSSPPSDALLQPNTTLIKSNQMPQRPKSIFQVCDLNAPPRPAVYL